jgi:molybdopterin converting factor small subunit
VRPASRAGSPGKPAALPPRCARRGETGAPLHHIIGQRASTGCQTGARPMTKVIFTSNIQRHIACPEAEAAGATVSEVLENLFAAHPRVRGYVLDDQAMLRKHMTIFVDGERLRDRSGLTDAVSDTSTIYVFQALSGG